MRTVLGMILIVCIYVIVYYRLLLRHYHLKATGLNESTFWSIFSPPPYATLPVDKKKYARRYWYALLALLLCIAGLAATSQLIPWQGSTTSG